MRVTIFNGSPRKNGNTSELVKRVLCSLDGNTSCEVISLYERTLKAAVTVVHAAIRPYLPIVR
jgi:Multimeric flavodoxin WrbA